MKLPWSRRRPVEAEQLPPAGWAWDATKRHQFRYWNGTEWTDAVLDRGVHGSDPELPHSVPPHTSGSHDHLTVDSFYDEDSRRRASAEVSYGQTWHLAADPEATYSLAFVIDTGELYTVRVGVPVVHFLEGLLDILFDSSAPSPSYHSSDLEVEVLLNGRTADQVSTILWGWESRMAEPDGLSWVRSQIGASPSAAS